ncbi:hypothetical protein D0869_14098 [Hortaea werneckii]|uniref:SigF-like NTF2-like domain-containing protein n=1 Tax=Hortaea werneckii TaxID=91943 RepID=A0A3M6W395_HORWE|nr:hypothetical protein KC334_g13644 [Hortaea werneckii]KAI6948950.1 hypothetical protein KC355_g14573 [Hortaea werneckii]KAI7201749.1 hypothetical protein KC324_g2058 [Hortaea werneckii]KAI7589298.1 hypothetical protein KC316_g4022 [Hortaea werneckii]KAI7661324.1 hypothetical protein KC318_g9527 [Hortaea werneckii]
MDDPIQEITPVVHLLTQGSPQEQEDAINKYFTPDASFTHPFCQTWSFNGSRKLIHSIFKWYKIMSPKIDLQVNSVAYDEANLILYLNITQTFAIWFIPFHRSPVNLTTVLHLTRSPSSKKYLIKSQNDLYQVDQFVRFFLPWGGIGTTLVSLWHAWATFFCVVLAWIFAPFLRLEQAWAERRTRGAAETRLMRTVDRIEEVRMRGRTSAVARRGEEDAAETLEDLAGRVRVSGRETDAEGRRLMGFGSEGAGDKTQFGSMQVVRPN